MPANRIKELRTEAGISQRRIARELGVHESTVSKWEAGKHPIPDWRKAQLAEMFGVSVAFLMGWDNNGGNGHTAVAA